MSILLVRDGCDFCKDLPPLEGLVVFRVLEMDGVPHMEVNETMLPLPSEVIGLPALLVEGALYIGKTFIKKKIEELAHASA
jgi:hypothetical protein